MTSTTNASAILADSLAQFSKAAYSAFTEIENQSRLEVLRAVSETREARKETLKVRTECDEIARNLHAATLEAQGWKQAAADAKAALAQAELTISHQAENIESQHRTIAELQREVSQWKDQSRNWQEHFLRVEGERCAQSSRIDELMKLQYTRSINTTLFTPKQKYASASPPPHTINSAPQSRQTNYGTTLKRQRDVPLANSSEESPQTPAIVPHTNLSSSKRKTKKPNNSTLAATSSNSHQLDSQTPVASHSALIRRVQAVVHVKREESDYDSAEDFSATADIVKDDAASSDGNEIVGTNKRRFSRRSRKIIEDDDYTMGQDYLAADANPILESRHLRHRNAVANYREEDEDEDDDDDDELMMGAEVNHDEVYGTQRVESLNAQRSKQQQPLAHPTTATAPRKKKRKVAAR